MFIFLNMLYFSTCSLQFTRLWSLDVSVPLKFLALMRACLIFSLQYVVHLIKHCYCFHQIFMINSFVFPWSYVGSLCWKVVLLMKRLLTTQKSTRCCPLLFRRPRAKLPIQLSLAQRPKKGFDKRRSLWPFVNKIERLVVNFGRSIFLSSHFAKFLNKYTHTSDILLPDTNVIFLPFCLFISRYSLSSADKTEESKDMFERQIHG